MEDTTEFNSNAEVLKRVNNNIAVANLYAESEHLVAWFKELEKIRKDVVVKMKHKKKNNKCVESCVKCKNQSLFNNLRKTQILYRQMPKQLNVKEKFQLWLDDYQIFLMEFMNEKGMMLRDEGMDSETPDEW